MFRKATFILLIAGLMIVTFGCNGYQKILKSSNNELKYETAIDYYEKGNFNRALQFFDILRAVHRGTPKGELLTYYTANCYFQMKDYNIASYYYKQYTQLYPRGEHVKKAAFTSAYCNYLDSPRSSLDQTSTFTALKELQNYIDMYPNDDKVEEATRLMDELRDKLEIKDYDIAKLYYYMDSYQAAITSFENILEDYPDTDYQEDILYYITKAYYKYAEKSIYTKQKDRYEKTVEAYNNLMQLYPESKYLKEVENISDNARKNL
ncbi:MAG: outer membrane protein assembly factor BamD [Marinilabiliales bacterium]|nr:MAG: outer membrane protein assembly factor BamD [Marinilabiliales bacterium]